MVKNAWDALAVDTEFYSEFDDDCGFYVVCGLETGFCYSTHSGSEDAAVKAAEMNQRKLVSQ